MSKNEYGIPRYKPYNFGLSLGMQKQTKRRKRKKTNASIRQHIPRLWKEKILIKQRKKCAGKECVKLSGRKAPIDIMAHFDHIKPVAMDGPHRISNIQGLCPTCHASKTREDRYKISQWKKKGTKKTAKRKQSRKESNKSFTFPQYEIPRYKPPNFKI